MEHVRLDVLFYEPGNDRIWQSREDIPSGGGRLQGRVLIDGKPASGLKLALILATGRRTSTVETDKAGAYSIPIPKGDYHLNGVVIFNDREQLEGRLLVNRLASEQAMEADLGGLKSEVATREFQALSAKLGPEEAGRKLAERFAAQSATGRSFPFKVGDQPFTLADLRYQAPVKILAPVRGETLPLAKVALIWEPYAGAASYKVEVFGIEEKGNSTSYQKVLGRGDLRSNSVGLSELQNLQSDCAECPKKPLDQFTALGLRVIALDAKGQVLSASSDETSEGIRFKVK
jgi:hypothetical protein